MNTSIAKRISLSFAVTAAALAIVACGSSGSSTTAGGTSASSAASEAQNTAQGDIPDNQRRTLTVGVIHGNETAGLAVTRDLAQRPPPKEALLWIVGKLNPDGVAAGTRQNADRVDLNRNFPYRWRPLGVPGDLTYSGPHALSEPEARIAHSLILRVRPQVTVWFHQPLGLVDQSGGSLRVERRFARLAGLPLRRLTSVEYGNLTWKT